MLLLNDTPIDVKKFPNGETELSGRAISNLAKEENVIKLRFESDFDLMNLLFVKSHLDSLPHVKEVSLAMPYVPYSRMDRTEGIAVFTLKTVAKFINSMNFNRVIVFEAHSDVTLALFDRIECKYMYQTTMIDEVKAQLGFDDEKDFLFYPDAGAEKRYKGKIKGKHLFGIKERNFVTREIESFQIVGNTLDTDSFNRIIIIDDLSSYGRTFLESAEALHEQFGFKEIYLMVGHAEDKIIEGAMIQSELIKKIFTTDSILTKTHEKIHVFDEFGLNQYTN